MAKLEQTGQAAPGEMRSVRASDGVKIEYEVVGAGPSIALLHGGFASRQTINAGSSAHIAARAVRDKALKVAADVLGVAADTLALQDGRVIAPGSNLSIGLGDLSMTVIVTPGHRPDHLARPVRPAGAGPVRPARGKPGERSVEEQRA